MSMSSSQSHLILFFLLLISLSISASALRPISESKVGGRTAVANVEANREVQELGRYCVEQYNRRFRSGSGSPAVISFSVVVSAERQVVSGIKYYLTIVARERTDAGGRRMFDAVVVVKPWAEVTDLVSFTPSGSVLEIDNS